MSKNRKILITILCVWTFTHTYLLINNWKGLKNSIVYNVGDDSHRNGFGNRAPYSPNERFYPFTVVKHKVMEYKLNYGLVETGKWDLPKSSYFNNNFYDFTEYFVYVGGVWMLYFLYWFYKKK